MSYRIVIEPAYIGDTPGDTNGTDWILPATASDEAIEEAARELSWKLPLRIFTPSKDNPVFLHFTRLLEEEWNMTPESYTVYVKPPS
jgi:hypothetical protein